MKTTLAPTAELATPRVEKFVKEKVLPYLGGTLDKFYLCNPSTMDVESRDSKERWVEGSWGAHILCDSFSSNCIYDLNNLSPSINVNEASVSGAPNSKLNVNIWLSARVMR